jgi:hypothetical protein
MNAFELRLNLLNMARDMLDNQYQAQVQAWELMEKFADQHPYPKFPTFQDVIDRASEMNKFISESK